MKTLEEVITEMEGCGFIGTGADALHYLKEYKDAGINLDKLRQNIETYAEARVQMEDIVAEYVALKQYWAEQQANPALTWEQLKQMGGKPVWVEGEHGCIWAQKAWSLIRLEAENDDIVICISTDGGVHYEYAIGKEDYGTDWQAYRKERNVD